MKLIRRFIDWIEKKIAMRYIKRHKLTIFKNKTKIKNGREWSFSIEHIPYWQSDSNYADKEITMEDMQKLIDAIEKLQKEQFDDEDFKEIENEINS